VNAAQQQGYAIEPGVLASAMLAVLARPESFAELRSGRITEIPEAGSLDFLAALPVPRLHIVRSAEPAAIHAAASDRAQLEAAVRAAAKALSEARARSHNAQQALLNAEAKLAAAEERTRQAEADLVSTRRQHDRARDDAAAADAHLRATEDAAAEAERRLLLY
jgi:hypothetical protein